MDPLALLKWLHKKEDQSVENCCTSNNSNSLFHLVASLGHIKIGEWLLEEFPGLLNRLNANGQTPYAIAKLNGKTEFVNLIVSKGGKKKMEEDNSNCAVM